MAKIQFGLKSADAIQQNFKIIFDRLVRGYKSVMGRNPEGLDLIKIRFEAAEKARDSAKVVDRGGMTLDPSKPIMGGTQEGAALKSGIMKATGEGPREITEDTGEGFIDFVRRTDPEGAAKLQKEEDRIKAMIEAANKRAAKNLKDKKKKLDDPEEKAMGGRIGYKIGSIDKARRAFLKTAAGVGGGIAALKTGLLGLSKKAPEAIETVKETVSGAVDKVPPYFFRLVEKIRFMGEETLASQDKAIAKKYKDYVMEEDFAGNITIVKKGEDLQGNKLEDVYMSYKVDDVATKDKKGFARAEEYEEFTARPDAEGKMKDVEPGVPDEVIEEAGDVDAMTLKKAGGGLAYMLGE